MELKKDLIRMLTPDSIRDSIQMQTANSQVPTISESLSQRLITYHSAHKQPYSRFTCVGHLFSRGLQETSGEPPSTVFLWARCLWWPSNSFKTDICQWTQWYFSCPVGCWNCLISKFIFSWLLSVSSTRSRRVPCSLTKVCVREAVSMGSILWVSKITFLFQFDHVHWTSIAWKQRLHGHWWQSVSRNKRSSPLYC